MLYTHKKNLMILFTTFVFSAEKKKAEDGEDDEDDEESEEEEEEDREEKEDDAEDNCFVIGGR